MIVTSQHKVWLVKITAIAVLCETGSTLTGCDEHQSVSDETTVQSADSSSDTATRTGSNENTSGSLSGSNESRADTSNPSSTTTTTTHNPDSTTSLDAGVEGDAGPSSAPTSVVDAAVPDAAASTAFTDAFVDSGSPIALLEQARAEYREWQPRTEEPVHISAEIFGLCRLPSAAETEFVDSVHGHELALQDWLNVAARDGVASIESGASSSDAGVTFAVGATIVKEKLALVDGSFELAALGLMIKREPGFDPTNGDWQFGYWEPELGLSSSDEAQTSCGGCHALAGTDFVYVDDSWRLP